MTEKQVLQWIKVNLGPIIKKAITDSNCIYTEDWLAAMACREVGFLIMRYCKSETPVKLQVIHDLMKGDFSQRKDEDSKQYHGFGYWQIDVASYADFVKSGNWKDPYKTCLKAITVLDEKKAYILSKCPATAGQLLEDAVTAAYNTGQGNVVKSLQAGRDVNSTTFNKDYAKEVRRMRQVYAIL